MRQRHQNMKIYLYVSDQRYDIVIELDQLIIIYVYVTMLFWSNLPGRVSTAAYFTQTNEARLTIVCEGREKSTRYRLRKDKDSHSNITIVIIVLSCLFVIISLIYFAVSYHSKLQQPESVIL